ncbi:MAG: hypothetical protein PVH41_18650 [Anaerolineae bacterium]|jgi:hypothetical protein
MLFVALGKGKTGTVEERSARRIEWAPPEGAGEAVAEYWLQGIDPAVVGVFKADHISQIWAMLSGWHDVLDFNVYPAVEAGEGVELLKQMLDV